MCVGEKLRSGPSPDQPDQSENRGAGEEVQQQSPINVKQIVLQALWKVGRDAEVSDVAQQDREKRFPQPRENGFMLLRRGHGVAASPVRRRGLYCILSSRATLRARSARAVPHRARDEVVEAGLPRHLPTIYSRQFRAARRM